MNDDREKMRTEEEIRERISAFEKTIKQGKDWLLSRNQRHEEEKLKIIESCTLEGYQRTIDNLK